MHYYLYEIRNNTDGKIYVGVHKTKVLDDGYMGSGKIIKAAINKYGLENFTKTILEYFETSEEMYTKEKEIVNEEFLAREDTYNLIVGGLGGFNKDAQKNGGMKTAIKFLEDENFRNNHIEHLTKISKLGKDAIMQKYSNWTFGGKNHSPESIEKMAALCQGKQTGNKNSQFGTMWINDGKQNKKQTKTDPIPFGWVRGRIGK